ncbi:MAG: hypothetical protein VXZ84_06055 [Planctomycetota bacterium]|nr:hypothetical protein [Planctomycetota bacterium]
MRRINIKVLLILTTVVFLLLGVGGVIWYSNSDRASGVFLERAQTAEDEGNLREAIDSYLRYLAFRPTDQETKEHVALLAVKIAQREDSTYIERRRAFRRITRLLRSQPDRNDLRRSLVDVLLAQGAYADVKKQVDELAERDFVNTELDFIYANSNGALGEYDEAIGNCSDLIGFDAQQDPQFDRRRANAPEMLKAYFLFATVHRERGESREDERLADAAIEQMVKLNPNSAQAFLIRGTYLLETNTSGSTDTRRERLRRAKESLEKALTLDPSDVEVLMGNAEFARREKNYALALEYLEKAQKIAPEDEQIYIDQAITSRQNNDSEACVAYVKKGLEALPKNKKLTIELLNAHLASDQLEEARGVLQTMQETGMAPEFIDLAEARLLMFEGQWSLALNRFVDLRPRMLAVSDSSVAEIDALMARCYQNLGQWDQQLSTSRRLLGALPRSPAGLQAEAQSLMSMENYPEAYKVFGRLRRQMGDADFFEDASTRDVYMQLLSELGKELPRYQQELRRIQAGIYESENVESVDKVMIKARSLVESGKELEALDEVKVALAQFPENHDLQELYLAIQTSLSGPEEALAFLEEAITRQKNPWEKRPNLLSAKMELIAAIGGIEAASKLKALEGEIEQYDQDKQISLWLSLSRAHFSIAHALTEVDHCLQKAMALNPASRELAELSFETALLKNSEKAMLAALAHTEEIFGRQSDLWNFQRARYLIWAGTSNEDSEGSEWLEEIEPLVEKIERIRPRWHRLLQLKGLIAEEKRELEVAIDNYQRSLEFGPMDLQVAKKLIELLVNEGRISETQNVIDRLEVVPASMITTQALLHALAGEKEKALQIIQRINWDQVTEVPNWIWRGRILKLLGEERDAEDAVLRAVALDNNDLNATRALIDFAAEHRSAAYTFRCIQGAENRLTESSQMQSLLADIYDRFSRYTDPIFIEHYLWRAVAADPTNVAIQTKYVDFCIDSKRLGSAIAHLDGILEDHMEPEKQNEPVAVWARQTLARILSSQPDHQAFQQALGLLEANRVGGQLSQYDRRLKGFLLAQRDEPFYRQHGIRLLETIPERSLKRRESLALAELYFLSDRWRECKALMERLNVQHPKDIDLLSRYCEMLFEKGEDTQAERWLRRLEQVAPDSLPALKLKARDAKMQGKFALSEFEKSMLNSLSSGRQRPAGWQRVRMGKVFEAAELYEAAETQYRDAATQDEKFNFDLAAFLGRQGKLSEAIEVCTPIVSKENISDICTLLFNAISTSTQEIRSSDLQQLQDWIAMAKEEFPNDWKTRMQEAFLLDRQGNTVDAVERLNAMDWDKLSEFEQGMIANNRAYLNLKLGKNGDVIVDDLAIAFEKLGPRIEILDTRALASIQSKEFEDAIRDLNLATQFEPGSGRYHFHLALAYQGTDNRAAAKEALESAKMIGLAPSIREPLEKRKYEKLLSWLNK